MRGTKIWQSPPTPLYSYVWEAKNLIKKFLKVTKFRVYNFHATFFVAGVKFREFFKRENKWYEGV